MMPIIRLIRVLRILVLSVLFVPLVQASVTVQAAQNDVQDYASLQRGASLFMRHCFGCHAMQYQRYQRVMGDLHLSDAQRQAMLLLSPDPQSQHTDKMVNTLTAASAQQWFGAVPADLTLTAKVHGTDWLYTYLHAFYPDDSRPLGVNNRLVPNVAMPHVLEPLQQRLRAEEYDQVVRDIVNFLDYSSDPSQLTRATLGYWVLGFLLLFLLLTLLLKKEYWRDVH